MEKLELAPRRVEQVLSTAVGRREVEEAVGEADGQRCVSHRAKLSSQLRRALEHGLGLLKRGVGV